MFHFDLWVQKACPGLVIILVDEPNRGLDNDTAHQIDLLIANLWQQLQSTIILVTHDIEQAVFLGAKIYIMGGKPANIVKEFDVNLPFPRNRETRRTDRFLELKNKVEDFMYSL